MNKIFSVFFGLVYASPAIADIAFEKNNRIVLFSQVDNLLVRTTCSTDTLPVSIGTCLDERQEIVLSSVHNIAAPIFGGLASQHAQRASLWSVEVTRADEKIIELLNVSTDPTPDLSQLRADIDRLGKELTRLDNLSYALADQIALLEAELARNPDADVLALLNTRRNEKRAIDENRQLLIAEMESLRERILQAQGGIFDQATFEMVVNQRTEALREYTLCLDRVAAEEDRRTGYERILAYIGDHGFTYKFFGGSDRLSIEVANVLFKAFDQAVAESYDIKILRSQSQYVSCPGGFNAFCGMRARFIVPVTSRLQQVSCQIVDSVTPCYRLTLYKAEGNELIAIDGSTIAEEKPKVEWSYNTTPAQAWNLDAQGPWIVIGRCEHPGRNGTDLHFPGRVECRVKLRGP